MRRLLLLLAFAIPLSAQVRETVTVSVVEVPVTVVDRDGNPIRGLTAANFEIVDEGKARAITAFESIDFTSAEKMKAVSPTNPAARRNFMLLFDLSFAAPKSLARAQQAARDFVAKSVRPRDRVAIASVDVERGFRLLTAFTTDRTLLTSAIDEPQTFSSSDPLQITSRNTFSEQEVAELETARREGGNSGLAAENQAEIVRGANRNEDQYNRQRIERQLDILAGLGRSLRAIAGQKHVVLLTEGFDPRLVQGRDAGTSQEGTRENQALERGEFWTVDSDNRFGNAASLSLVDQMAQAFKRSDVTLHALDIQGLRVNNDLQTGTAKKSNEGLSLLAGSTGGEVFKNSNDLPGNFDKFVRRNDVVYVLGFNAPTSQPGKFHPLKVRLVNVPGGRISHRPGYYEAGNASTMERALSTAEIVLNDIPQTDVRVAALAAAFPTTSQNSQVPVIVEINGADLLKGTTNAATVELFSYAFDEDGIVRDSLFQRLSLDIAKAGDSIRRSGIKWYGTLALSEGTYAVRTLVRVKESGFRGFVRSDVTVPRAKDVAVLPPMFFEQPGAWVMVKGDSHDKTNAPYPFEVNGEAFIPRAEVRLDGKGPVRFAVFVQGATPDEITVEVTPAATLEKAVQSATGTKLLYNLGASDAKVLEVVVKKKGSADERRASLAIR